MPFFVALCLIWPKQGNTAALVCGLLRFSWHGSLSTPQLLHVSEGGLLIHTIYIIYQNTHVAKRTDTITAHIILLQGSYLSQQVSHAATPVHTLCAFQSCALIGSQILAVHSPTSLLLVTLVTHGLCMVIQNLHTKCQHGCLVPELITQQFTELMRSDSEKFLLAKRTCQI